MANDPAGPEASEGGVAADKAMPRGHRLPRPGA